MSLGRVLLVSLAVLAAGFGMWRYWWTALDHHPEQDACSFGSVTNDRYRALLARAKSLNTDRGPFWKGDIDATKAEIRHRLYEVAPIDRPLYERLAGIHAVMRSIGGYQNLGPGPKKNWRWEKFDDGITGALLYNNYIFHKNKREINVDPVVYFFYISIGISTEKLTTRQPDFRNNYAVETLPTVNLITTIFGISGNFQGILDFYRFGNTGFCMDIPPRDWTDRFEDWARSLPQPK